MIVEDVMDEVGEKLNEIEGLKVLPYEADDINTPAALVSLPLNIDFLKTYARGMDTMTLQITVLVSMVDDRVRRKHIAPYGDGHSSKSVKTALEKGPNRAYDTLAVASGRFTVVSIAGTKYLAVVFIANISGSGS